MHLGALHRTSYYYTISSNYSSVQFRAADATDTAHMNSILRRSDGAGSGSSLAMILIIVASSIGAVLFIGYMMYRARSSHAKAYQKSGNQGHWYRAHRPEDAGVTAGTTKTHRARDMEKAAGLCSAQRYAMSVIDEPARTYGSHARSHAGSRAGPGAKFGCGHDANSVMEARAAASYGSQAGDAPAARSTGSRGVGRMPYSSSMLGSRGSQGSACSEEFEKNWEDWYTF